MWLGSSGYADMLEAFFPPQNLKHIDPKTWEDRVGALADQ